MKPVQIGPRVGSVPLWTWMAGATAIAVVFAAAFATARASLDAEPHAPVDWRAGERARELDDIGRELSALFHELTPDPSASADERTRWELRIERDVRPRVTEFRRRVLARPHTGPAYEAVMHAADRLGAAAANPGDDRALNAAKVARDNAQSLIQNEGTPVQAH